MRVRLRRALVWCGFTPSHRERVLLRRLQDAQTIARERRRRLEGVERLLAFRERMGATTIDTASLRGALRGEEDPG